MKKISLLFCFLLPFLAPAHAQIGISAGVQNFDAPDWFDLETGSATDPFWGAQAGIDYWFRLKNQRVEFLPELSASRHSGDFGSGELTATFFNFRFNTNFYFFDFNNDCNCPTFDKGGNFFTKGFFIQLSPGISRLTLKNDPGNAPVESSDYALSFGIGAGLDIGLSKLITLTPLVRYRYFPGAKSEVFMVKEPVRSAIRQLYAGIRLGIRWSDGSGSGKRRGSRLSDRRKR
ncbi:MAG: hypothetical protein D6714_13310 [Bacteroidetes bacterium]|nr:MAG: hypothetical protein D6714_13310 [Bacteroidota bacterium]